MPSNLKMHYSIHTHLSPQHVQSRLKRNVGNHWDFFGNEPFMGVVEGDTFRISPRSYGRNSFKPVLHGSIYADDAGSIVRVSARLHPFVLIFSIVWLAIACRFLAAGISLAVHGGSLSLACISGLFLIGYFLLGGTAFFHGHQSAKQRLQTLLA